MNRIAIVSLFGMALAVVLVLGVPGKSSAFTNDNCTNGCMFLAGDLGITTEPGGEGIDINRYRADREQEHERARAHEQAKERDREDDQRRDYNREKAEETYDHN